MKCPKCQHENPKETRFCDSCGHKLEIACSECGKVNPIGSSFCNSCGKELDQVLKDKKRSVTEGERKYVTALFSDLSGYTTMSEKLDPEDVKEIMSLIFGEIAQVVTKYEGFIEKFVGDAVMAIFGVPKVHEDDPIRAIRAAKEIHDRVKVLSPEIEKKIGQSISMHTGINTGLVVTGEVNLEKGIHGVVGDTINVAARLSDMGNAGEILIGPATFKQAEGYFDFEELEPVSIRGRSVPIQIFKVIKQKEKPIKIHRLHGLRADLIGRKVEMNQLADAVQCLKKEKKGTVISICGAAGTGKSRLIEEFRSTLNFEEIQWLEGHAYPHSQSIPYYPLIDLLSRAFQIEESDSLREVREKLETVILALIREQSDLMPYIGSLFSLQYPEIEEVSPEYWKAQLHTAIYKVLTALAQSGPVIICLEDLHWADPSFLELIRLLISDFREPVLFLCAYRPIISLYSSHQIDALANTYIEIRLQDLSPSESQSMVESLLRTDRIPHDLQNFVQKKAEGNPFYLEEVINSLIESETLIIDNGNWEITKLISESDISITIHGVLSGRLDRLEKKAKRILQEASVIGRSFLYEILKRITDIKNHMDMYLSGLERLDLIKTRSLKPELEYVFKHALTQEVVYNGLLKKERQDIHERIGLVIEKLFQNKPSEFYETLAFHFKNGKSFIKAVDYLMKAGDKSLRRYAVEESHNYYKEAYEILINVSEKSHDNKELLVYLLNKWALVYYYRGDFEGLDQLLQAHEPLAESLGDSARVGMFYGWLGLTLLVKEKSKDSYRFLFKAMNLGERIDDKRVVAYACAWLTWTCAELGLLDEGIEHGNRALELCKHYDSDHYLFAKSLGGLGELYWYKGASKNALESGKTLIEYGNRHSNIRSLVMGHVCIGQSYFIKGDLISAIESFKDAVKISADPYYYHIPTIWLGAAHIMNGEVQEAEKALMKIMDFAKYGNKDLETWAIGLLGVVFLSKGQMSKGLKMLEEANQLNIEEEKKSANAIFEYILGTVFLQIIEGSEAISLSLMAKNIGFLARNIPFAAKKAEHHLNKALKISKDIGAKGIMGQAYLGLGLLYKVKGRIEQAIQCLSEAVKFSKECDAELYLKQAREALESLQ